MALLRSHPTPRSSLSLSTWLARHQVISVVFACWITVVVCWSAAAGHSGAMLLEYVTPLLAAGFVATRGGLSQDFRAAALVFGTFTAAALTAQLSGNSALAPLGYLVAIALASLYERRGTLVFGVGLAFAHETLFGTLVPPGGHISGLPDWAESIVYCGSFVIIAALLTVPWRSNDAQRVRLRAQQGTIDAQLAVSEFVVQLDTQGLVVAISEHGLAVLGRTRAEVIGVDWIEVIVPEEERTDARAAVRERADLGRPELISPGFMEFEHVLTCANGTKRTFHWRTTVTSVDGVVTGSLSSGLDVTDAREVEEQLLRQQRDLSQLAKLAQRVARETDARSAVVEGIRELAGAELAALMEPAAGGEEFIVTSCTRADLIGLRIPAVGSTSGTGVAFTSGKPLFVADTAEHPLINLRLIAPLGVASMLYQPVICDDRVAAVMSVAWADRIDRLDARESNLVALAADEAASALMRIAAMKRWEEAALTDVLTGIANRRAFDHMFDDAIEHARSADQPLAVALMDLNGFKRLNDTEGHAAGDRVLKECASLWLDELRPTDVLARLGGDEFAVLLPNCGSGDIESVARRLRAAPRHESGCGVGVAVWDGEEPISALLHRADENLYADKARQKQPRLADPVRLEAIETSGLPKMTNNPKLDALTDMVTQLLGVPWSMISTVSEAEQIFSSTAGMPDEYTVLGRVPVEASYCQYPATTGRELIVGNTHGHALLGDNPSTTDGGIGAYAGIPLMADGETYGVICAVSLEPREWSAEDLGALRSVARRAAQIIAEVGDVDVAGALEVARAEAAHATDLGQREDRAA